jgi:hypothetical protein
LGTDAHATTPGTTENEVGGDEPPIRFRGDEADLFLAHNDQLVRDVSGAVRAHRADIEVRRCLAPHPQEWMGHRDAKTTLIYADYLPDPHEAAIVNDAFPE